jgi:hypothetical protein
MPAFPISQPGSSARLPTPPTSVSASASAGTVNGTAGAVTVSFTASTNPGKPSGNYVATSSPGSVTASASSSTITFSAGTLTAGTAYTFSIVKQSGSGITSAAATTGSVTPYTVPAAPTSVSASANATSGQIVVSWTAPSGAANTGGSAITNYYVDYSTSSTFASGVTTINTGSTSTSRTVGSLTNGTTYYFRVRAENAAGQSGNSSSANDAPYTTPTLANSSISSTTPTVTNTSYSNVSQDYALLSGTVSYGTKSFVVGTSSGSYIGEVDANGHFAGLAWNTNYYWKTKSTASSHTVSFSGSINPNGRSTSASAQWSTASDFSSIVRTASLGTFTGTTTQSVSDSFAGATSTTYYVRIYAVQNSVGSTSSSQSVGTASSVTLASSESTFKTYRILIYFSRGGYDFSGSSIAVNKPSWGSDIIVRGVCMIGGGGGGDCIRGSFYGAGAGGGGQDSDVAANTYTVSLDGNSNGTISIAVGGGGSGGTSGALAGFGGTSSISGFTTTGPSIGGGNPGLNNDGGPSGSNAGAAGYYDWNGGGGGGSGGAASGGDGGIGTAYSTIISTISGGGGGAGSNYLFSQGFGSSSSGGGSNSAGSAGTGGGGGGGAYTGNANQNGFAGGSGFVFFYFFYP